MVERQKAQRMSYTPRERQELKQQFSQVLDRCSDRQLGVAIAAAARALRERQGGKHR